MSELARAITNCLKKQCGRCPYVDNCELKPRLINWARRNDLVLYGPDPDTEGWRDALAEVLCPRRSK